MKRKFTLGEVIYVILVIIFMGALPIALFDCIISGRCSLEKNFDPNKP
jgi:hypothetical protein